MFNQTDSRSYTTADSNASPEAITKKDTKSTTLVVRNTGNKTATYNIQGSVDGTHWVDLTEAADLAKEKSAKHLITDYWPFLNLVAKSKEEGKSTTLELGMASIAA